MKNYFFLVALLITSTTTRAQNNSTVIENNNKISITGKRNGDSTYKQMDTTVIKIGRTKIKINSKNIVVERDSSKAEPKKHKNIENNWLGLDLGLCNFQSAHTLPLQFQTVNTTKVNYPFELRQSKSINVKLYLIQQRVNLIQHHLNFRWGLGVTWDNYRFNGNNKNTDLLKNKTDGTLYAIDDSVNYTKNKFVTKYLTVPTMLEFSFGKKDSWKSFRLAAGLEFNLLLEGWQKQVSAERGKEHRFEGDYNLSQMPINYVVRLGVGKLNFYGTYALTPMFNTSQTSLTSSYLLPKMYPWAIGIQLNGL